jgi:DedD protein
VDAPHSRNGGWAVQMGSFASEENADKLAHQLKGQGYPVYVLSNGTGPNLRHRVRLGPLADRDAALRVMAKLKAQGRAASLVAP